MSEVKEVVKRLVIYPVNVGDKVYVLLPGRKRIAEATVKSVTACRYGMYDYYYLLTERNTADGETALLQCIYGITAFKELEDAEKELCYKQRC